MILPASNPADSELPRYVVLHGEEASDVDIEAVLALDRDVFAAQYQVTAQRERELFEANRENGLLVKVRATGEVVAYAIIVPVREDVYRQIRSGHFVDTFLTKDMVMAFDRPGDDYRIYFAAVVIHPLHRSASLLMTIVDTMVEDFIALAERGVFGQTLTADVVSREGEKLAQLLGLVEICKSDHGSTIFESTVLPPSLRATTPAMRRLLGLYREHFSGGRTAKLHCSL